MPSFSLEKNFSVKSNIVFIGGDKMLFGKKTLYKIIDDAFYLAIRNSNSMFIDSIKLKNICANFKRTVGRRYKTGEKNG